MWHEKFRTSEWVEQKKGKMRHENGWGFNDKIVFRIIKSVLAHSRFSHFGFLDDRGRHGVRKKSVFVSKLKCSDLLTYSTSVREDENIYSYWMVQFDSLEPMYWHNMYQKGWNFRSFSCFYVVLLFKTQSHPPRPHSSLPPTYFIPLSKMKFIDDNKAI